MMRNTSRVDLRARQAGLGHSAWEDVVQLAREAQVSSCFCSTMILPAPTST
jgi:hypothetical protein